MLNQTNYKLSAYAKSAINKRWYFFNKTIDEEITMQGNKKITSRVADDISTAYLENMQCDKDLKKHFVTI